MALTQLTQITGQTGISTTIDYTMSDLVVDTISVGGTITYNDVTSVDSIGIITARKGIQVIADGLNVTGVTTVGTALSLGDNIKAQFGNSGDIKLYHQSSDNHSYFTNSTGDLNIQGDVIRLKKADGGKTMAAFHQGGSQDFYYDTTRRLYTTTTGAALDYKLTIGGAAGSPGIISLVEGGAVSEIRVTRNSDANSDLQFKTERGDGTQVRAKINYSGDFVVPAGKIGIGIDNPAMKLHLHEDSSLASYMIFTNSTSGGTNNDGLIIGLDSNEGANFWLNESDYMKFGTADTERLRITSTGEVGIGTVTPGQTLDVWGNLQVKDTGGEIGLLVDPSVGYFQVNQSVASWTNTDKDPVRILGWGWKSGTGNHMFMASGGNDATASQMALIISEGHGFKVGRSAWDGTNGDISSTAEYFRITNAGKVGIGTDNPAKKVEVFDTTQGVIRIRGGGGGSDTSRKADLSLFASGAREYVVRADASDAAFKIVDVSGSNAERLTITSGGDVLIADTSNSLYNDSSGGGMNLKANGQLVLAKEATSAADPLIWLNDTGQTTNRTILFAQDGTEKGHIGLTGSSLSLGTGGGDRLTIASDGKVGINTTTLTEQLEVDGDIRVRSAIKFREDNGTETGNISLNDDDNLTIQSFGTSGHITFDTGSSAAERLRIDSTGLVRVGKNDISSNTQATTLRIHGSYVNAVGAFAVLDFRNRDNAGSGGVGPHASIRGVRDGIVGGNYSAGLTFHTNSAAPGSASDGDHERLRITSDGKIGVGIDAPNAMMQIVSSQNAETDRFNSSNYHLMLQNTGNDTGEAVGMGFAISDDTDKVGGAILFERSGGGSAGSLQFYTNSDGASVTERLRINSGGQLVAGATVTGTEGGGAKLCIVGTGAVGANPSSIAASTLATFRMTGAAGHAAGISILAGNGASSALNFGDSDNELIGRILYNHTSGNANDYMAFYVQGSEKLQITSAGHLQLQGGTIYGDDSALPTFTLQNTSGNSNHCRIVLGNSVGSDNGGIEFWTAGTSAATKKFSIRGNNNYIEVIGTNTLRFDDGKLNINHNSSNAYIRNTTGQLLYRSATHTFESADGSTEYARIASDGTTTATGTSDGVLQLDTSDSRGAFVRFGQGGSYHHMIGCADGLVAGPDKEDLGLRAKDNMVFCTNGANERLRITSGGTLVIGDSASASPAGKLHLYQASNDPYMYIQRGSGDSATTIGGIFFKNSTNNLALIDVASSDINDGYMKFSTMGAGTLAERVRIHSNGQVRIGGSITGTPQCTFDVVRTTGLTDVMLVKGNVGNGFIRFQDNDNSCNWTMGVDDGSGIGANGFILYDRVNSAYRWSVDNGGNMRVWSGNIKVASGQGIDFSAYATSGNPSSNLLDDYEEGLATFQLHINGSEASGVSYSYNTAPYVKVGRIVYCAVSMFATNVPNTTGAIDIQGLPFTDGGGGGYREPTFVAANHGGVSTSVVLTGALHGNNTKIRIRKNGNQDLNGSDIGGTFWMHGHITYKANT